MQLTVIGSGDAFCAAGALHSCYLLEHGGGAAMLECGPCVLAGMKRLGVDTGVPDAVFISHLHGDHFAGLPFLFLEYTYMNPRSRPLTLVGPAGIEECVFELYNQLYRGMECRKVPFELEVVEARPGDTVEAAGLTAAAFEVPHNATPYSLGYRFETAEGAMLFSGDSSWTDEFVAQSRGTDLFLCECCCMEPTVPVHTSYREIHDNLDRLECGRLLLTHLSAEVREVDQLEVERAYDGQTVTFGTVLQAEAR